MFLGSLFAFIFGNNSFSSLQVLKRLLSLLLKFLDETKILILDEATSSLSHSMENRMLSAIGEVFKHSTVLTITHRVHKVMSMDRVLVIDSGSVKEFEAPVKLAEDSRSMFHSMLKESKVDIASTVAKSSTY